MNAGGFVSAGRVNASLNLSRALGDMEYKQNVSLPPKEQIVTAYPEVRSVSIRICAFCSLSKSGRCSGDNLFMWSLLCNRRP